MPVSQFSQRTSVPSKPTQGEPSSWASRQSKPQTTLPPRRRLEIPSKPSTPLNSSAPHETEYSRRANASEEESQISFNFKSEDSTDSASSSIYQKRNLGPRFSVRDNELTEDVVSTAISSKEDFQIKSRLASEEASESSRTQSEEYPESEEEKAATEAFRQEDELEKFGSDFSGPTNRAAIPPTESSTWTGFAVLSSAVMGFLALLVVGSLYLRSDTTTASGLMRTLFPTAPRVAPTGLYIKNTQLKKITLDSGDSVSLVSGKVVNQANEAFSDVIIEAIAFDALGKPLMKNKVAASNTLARTRIKSLTPEMIKNIQTQDGSAAYTLRAGQSEDFAIALGNGENPSELSKARYFSARIYSVKN